MKPVTWNEEAYDHLVYSEEYKDLALTFVQNHQRLSKITDDVIRGKGMGPSHTIKPQTQAADFKPGS